MAHEQIFKEWVKKAVVELREKHWKPTDPKQLLLNLEQDEVATDTSDADTSEWVHRVTRKIRPATYGRRHILENVPIEQQKKCETNIFLGWTKEEWDKFEKERSLTEDCCGREDSVINLIKNDIQTLCETVTHEDAFDTSMLQEFKHICQGCAKDAGLRSRCTCKYICKKHYSLESTKKLYPLEAYRCRSHLNKGVCEYYYEK